MDTIIWHSNILWTWYIWFYCLLMNVYCNINVAQRNIKSKLNWIHTDHYTFLHYICQFVYVYLINIINLISVLIDIALENLKNSIVIYTLL